MRLTRSLIIPLIAAGTAAGACSSASDPPITVSAAATTCEETAAQFATRGSANDQLTEPISEGSCVDGNVVVVSNGIPDYTYIETSPGNPRPQDYSFVFPGSPVAAAEATAVPLVGPIGVALNGVPIYGPTEGTGGDVLSLTGALSECGSHNGPGGFHLHLLGTSTTTDCIFTPEEVAAEPQLLGYAFDGFPIYSGNDQYESSWTLSDASLFATDTWAAHSYVEGSGDLDECNGLVDEQGDYAYYTTDTFPYVLGCFVGEVDIDEPTGGPGGGGGGGGQRPPGDEEPAAPDEEASDDIALDGEGYWMVERSGVVHPFGTAIDVADGVDDAVALATIPDGAGVWVLASDGSVHVAGTASHHGDAVGLDPDVDGVPTTLAAVPDGTGYWVFTDRGRALAFGAAPELGDMADTVLNGPVIAAAATPTGLGYYLVGDDGGVFSFGDAAFHGSMGGTVLNGPVVGIAPDPDGAGYWLVADDGGIFAFDADFRGSMGGTTLNEPVVGAVAFGGGYVMVAADGGAFVFSEQPFLGSLGSDPPPTSIVGIAAFSTLTAA